ncbi:MAG TPA: cytochrome c [Aliidongia sp.]|nr:cytochrome c [Aliidongia sp.]
MMKLRRILPICLVLVAGAAWAQTAPVLKSVSVDLPAGDRLFPGDAAADAINNNCVACHSAGMVLTQPNLSKTAWEAVVHKMIAVYKAPIDDKDVPAIVDYLVKNKGAG